MNQMNPTPFTVDSLNVVSKILKATSQKALMTGLAKKPSRFLCKKFPKIFCQPWMVATNFSTASNMQHSPLTTHHELMTTSPQAAVITRINIVVKLFPLIQPHFDQASIVLVNDLRCSAWEGVGRRLSEDVTLQAAAIRREKGCSSKKFTGN